jgi:glycosyltransferase involved in cell wall biosynthesis
MSVYNGKEFLAEAVQSVLDQTYQSFELIALDDGSTDGSADILADYARRDRRIVFWRTENRGVAAALNSCLEKARNDLVFQLDADDVMLPNRLERQIWFMQQHPEISAVCSYAWLIDRNGNLLAEAKPTIDVERGIRERKPAYFVHIIDPACVMRREHIQAVGGYSRAFHFEHRELWGRLVASGYLLAVQPEFLIKRRLHRSSITGSEIRRNTLEREFIDQNIVRSLQGQTYISFEAFLENRRRTPAIERLARRASEFSKECWYEAILDFAERKWWRLLMHSTATICLNPTNGLRMFTRIVHRKDSWTG